MTTISFHLKDCMKKERDTELFFSNKNMALLANAEQQAKAGKGTVKTMAELEAME